VIVDGYIKFASCAEPFLRIRKWCRENGYLIGKTINASEEAHKLGVKLDKADAGCLFLQVLQRCKYDTARCSGSGVVTINRGADKLVPNNNEVCR
jgi:hypothetical protein